MSWIKRNQLFNWSNYSSDSVFTHASVPFALPEGENRFLIYFGSRNASGHSVPFCIQAQFNEGKLELIDQPIGPLMEVGELGSFDDSGVMPTCVIKNGDEYWMYYIGWNPQVTVSYRLSIGLAISKDGIHFERYSNAPIMDRCLEEPFFNTAPYVVKKGYAWEMFYVSCTGWHIIDHRTEPQYTIKSAQSKDGIHWERSNKILLDYDEVGQAFGRPCVISINGHDRCMFFSYRKLAGYRNEAGNAYQIAVAKKGEAEDNWQKYYQDTLPLGISDDWDEMMACYGHVFEHQGKFLMLYNGNDFGKTGFGYAEWKP